MVHALWPVLNWSAQKRRLQLSCKASDHNTDEDTHPAAAAAAKLLQSYQTLCDPTDSSPPGSPVPGILQARTLEWVANSFSNAWKWKVKVKPPSRVRLLATPWTAAYQAPPSMGFSRQEYWSGVPLPSPDTHPGSDQIQSRGRCMEKSVWGLGHLGSTGGSCANSITLSKSLWPQLPPCKRKRSLGGL